MDSVGTETYEDVRETELAEGQGDRAPFGLRKWLKSDAELEQMAAAGKIVWEVLELIGERLKPGTSTEELDGLAERLIRSRGGTPTFKGYRGYPASICASPNSMVVHGIPNGQRLRRGDTLSVDVGVTVNGYVADAAKTFPVGATSEEANRIMRMCRAALWAGIGRSLHGGRVSDISHAVEEATISQGYSVIRTLVGHGVGKDMHEPPQIPNYGPPGQGEPLHAGMTLAIEPMITAGGSDVFVSDDGWSIWTSDGSLASHFEHTVAVTASGPCILTAEAPISVSPEMVAAETSGLQLSASTAAF